MKLQLQTLGAGKPQGQLSDSEPVAHDQRCGADKAFPAFLQQGLYVSALSMLHSRPARGICDAARCRAAPQNVVIAFAAIASLAARMGPATATGVGNEPGYARFECR